jgi:glyoxylase-like metal-dependent hydrolase (beta-lactamase superfamily II)
LIAEREPKEIEEEKQWAPVRYHYYDSLQHAFQGDTTSREYQEILILKPYFEVLSKSHLEIKTRLPDTFVEDEMSLDGPRRKIQLITKGAGHSESDLILYLPDARILFTGDLVFNDAHPYMAQGNLQGWNNWLTFMESLNVEAVVPGHGEVGNANELTEMKIYIKAIKDIARSMIADNIHAGKAGDMEIPDPYKDYWFEAFFISNLKYMHGQLSEQD